MTEDDDGGLQYWQEVGQWWRDPEYEAWLDKLDAERMKEIEDGNDQDR